MKDFLSSNDVLFLVLAVVQVVDTATGIGRVRSRDFSASKLKSGLLTKIADWAYIAIAFGAAYVLSRLGNALEVNFRLARILGWVMLASVLYKEVRSVFDNLSEIGIPVPTILKKALTLSEEEFDGELTFPSDSLGVSLKLNKTLPELDGKTAIKVKLKK